VNVFKVNHQVLRTIVALAVDCGWAARDCASPEGASYGLVVSVRTDPEYPITPAILEACVIQVMTKIAECIPKDPARDLLYGPTERPIAEG
jgi:hypothetical protein